MRHRQRQAAQAHIKRCLVTGNVAATLNEEFLSFPKRVETKATKLLWVCHHAQGAAASYGMSHLKGWLWPLRY